MRKGILFLLFSLLLCSGFAQSAEELLDQIDRAIAGEFYNQALSLLGDGARLFPGDARFPQAEGALYSSRKLYNLAHSALVRAEVLAPEDREIRQDLASVLGFLDRNEEALVYLEELVREEEDFRLIDDLGWMYFKTHQPEKGIPILEEALEKEFRKSLALTLGTLYSEINDQERCRKHYLDSIESALASGDSYFASVAYYNLALAEQSFYSYEQAIAYARLSIEQMDRAGGHLALGDLYLMKGDYSGAIAEILKAEPLDETPLTTMNLASFYRKSGNLNAALQLAGSLRDSTDDSWMYYYGIDSSQFAMDLHELHQDIHQGLYHRERLSVMRGGGEAFRRLFRRGKHYALFRYHDAQYRFLAYQTGRVQWERSSLLRGSLTLASASQGVRGIALKYLRQARRLESGIPGSAAWYDLEIGRETGDIPLLYRAVRAFQTEWEARLIEDGYREILLARRRGRFDQESIRASVAIFRQNAGGLKQYGLKLPVHCVVTGTDSPGLHRRLRRQLSRQGVAFTKDYTGTEATLRVHFLPGELLRYSLTWPEGSLAASGVVEIDGPLGNSVYELARALSASLFP